MAIDPKKDLSRLRSWLATSGLQRQNAALHQTISELIDRVENVSLLLGVNGGVGNTIQNINQITQLISYDGGSDNGEEGSIGPPGERGLIGPTGPTGPAGSGGSSSEMPFGIDGEDGEDSYIQLISNNKTTNANDLTSGTLADGRLSANVPLKNAANVFTAINTFQDTVLTNEGIEFPATQFDAAGANILDDYEEGTWTPNDASGAGLTFTGVSGTYVKIGKVVYLTWELRYPSTANASLAAIGGFPFTTGKSGGFALGLISAAIPMYIYVPSANTQMQPIKQAGGANMTNTDLSLAFLWGSGFYFV